MTDLLSAEDIKKAIGAFAGERCTPLPGPVPLPSSRAWGTPHPSAEASPVSPAHISVPILGVGSLVLCLPRAALAVRPA